MCTSIVTACPLGMLAQERAELLVRGRGSNGDLTDRAEAAIRAAMRPSRTVVVVVGALFGSLLGLVALTGLGCGTVEVAVEREDLIEAGADRASPDLPDVAVLRDAADAPDTAHAPPIVCGAGVANGAPCTDHAQ